ncbi:zinc ribbon domain-containing protein [Pseudoneobacillus sp. C159]
MQNFGVFLLLLGIGMMGFAGYDFFTLGTWEEPKYFWMFFVGGPLLFIGFVLNGARFQKTMLNQHKENIHETMKVMGEGLRAGLNAQDKFCSNCGNGASSEDKFCSKCGKSLLS